MALPQRVDDYGKPIQPLVDAREEILVDRPFNRHMRQVIRQKMDEKNQTHCRRSHYVRVTIQYDIHDGVIQGAWRLTAEELYNEKREA